MSAKTLLITGCGGDIAIALARIARSSGAAQRLIGCDLHKLHAGSFFFDEVETIVPASSPDYLNRLADMARRHSADAIVPSSEAELSALLAADCLDVLSGVPVIAANRRAVETGLDKLLTARTLLGAGVPTPWTRVVGEEEPLDLPCIIKQRRGQGSKGFAVVEDWSTAHFAATRKGDLWQQYLPADDQEYTCGLYRSGAGELRTILFRRKLQGGLTGSGEVVRNKAIEASLAAIAETLDLKGAVNVQLRLLDDVPYVFEINPRFSSTVGFRHQLGFQDFLWALGEAESRPPGDYAPPPEGTLFFRVGTEFILPPPAA